MGLIILNIILIQGFRNVENSFNALWAPRTALASDFRFEMFSSTSWFAPPPAYYLLSPNGLHSKPNTFNNHLNSSNIADCYVSEILYRTTIIKNWVEWCCLTAPHATSWLVLHHLPEHFVVTERSEAFCSFSPFARGFTYWLRGSALRLRADLFKKLHLSVPKSLASSDYN